jgi:hypothetical protein
MKKIISVISALVVTGSLFAGGLVTNTTKCSIHQAAEPQCRYQH